MVLISLCKFSLVITFLLKALYITHKSLKYKFIVNTYAVWQEKLFTSKCADELRDDFM